MTVDDTTNKATVSRTIETVDYGVELNFKRSFSLPVASA